MMKVHERLRKPWVWLLLLSTVILVAFVVSDWLAAPQYRTASWLEVKPYSQAAVDAVQSRKFRADVLGNNMDVGIKHMSNTPILIIEGRGASGLVAQSTAREASAAIVATLEEQFGVSIEVLLEAGVPAYPHSFIKDDIWPVIKKGLGKVGITL